MSLTKSNAAFPIASATSPTQAAQSTFSSACSRSARLKLPPEGVLGGAGIPAEVRGDVGEDLRGGRADVGRRCSAVAGGGSSPRSPSSERGGTRRRPRRRRRRSGTRPARRDTELSADARFRRQLHRPAAPPRRRSAGSCRHESSRRRSGIGRGPGSPRRRRGRRGPGRSGRQTPSTAHRRDRRARASRRDASFRRANVTGAPMRHPCRASARARSSGRSSAAAPRCWRRRAGRVVPAVPHVGVDEVLDQVVPLPVQPPGRLNDLIDVGMADDVGDVVRQVAVGVGAEIVIRLGCS